MAMIVYSIGACLCIASLACVPAAACVLGTLKLISLATNLFRNQHEARPQSCQIPSGLGYSAILFAFNPAVCLTCWPLYVLVPTCMLGLLSLCLLWCCLGALVAHTGVGFGKAFLGFKVRRTLRVARRTPLLAVGGVTLVLGIMTFDFIMSRQQNVEDWAWQACEEVPALQCWFWAVRLLRFRLSQVCSCWQCARQPSEPRERLRATQRTRKIGLHVLRENERRRWMRVVEPWRKSRADRTARRADSRKALQGYALRIIARGMASSASQLAASRDVEPSTGSCANDMPLAVTAPRALVPDGVAGSVTCALETHYTEANCDPVVTGVGARAQGFEPTFLGEIDCDAYEPEPLWRRSHDVGAQLHGDALGHAPECERRFLCIKST